MEIKYTLEILTKDIQDIGKLVENLQFSQGGSTLELDLALSKLRNVYDILTVIREDLKQPVQAAVRAPEATTPPEPVVETPLPKPVTQTPEPVTQAAEPVPVVQNPEPVMAPPEPEPKAKTEPVPESVVKSSG